MPLIDRPEVRLRDLAVSDRDAIASLHLASWRATYRGIISDDFLEHAAAVNREETWRYRLSPEHVGEIRGRVASALGASDALTPAPDTTMASGPNSDATARPAAILGFSCCARTRDSCGIMLDNLHVRPDLHGRGIGRMLIADAAAWVAHEHPGAAIYLWVYEKNLTARAFYDRMGGSATDRLSGRAPDGGSAASIRYVWLDPRALAETATSRRTSP